MAKKYKVGRIKENFVGTGTSSVAATGDDPTVAISVEKLKQLRKDRKSTRLNSSHT